MYVSKKRETKSIDWRHETDRWIYVRIYVYKTMLNKCTSISREKIHFCSM